MLSPSECRSPTSADGRTGKNDVVVEIAAGALISMRGNNNAVRRPVTGGTTRPEAEAVRPQRRLRRAGLVGPAAPAGVDLLDLTAEIVTAHAARSPVDVDLLPELIRSVHRTLAGVALGQASAPAEQKQLRLAAQPGPVMQLGPAVPVHRSVTPGHIVCLHCGMWAGTLRRHLANQHGLTPEAYRAHWGLPRDYPVVARHLSERRSVLAKQIGLGRSTPVAEAPADPARGGGHTQHA